MTPCLVYHLYRQLHTERIVQLLQNIQAHKTSGPNNLPACFLKGVANEIAFVLTIISQTTLDQRSLPCSYLGNSCSIVPIVKKGK